MGHRFSQKNSKSQKQMPLLCQRIGQRFMHLRLDKRLLISVIKMDQEILPRTQVVFKKLLVLSMIKRIYFRQTSAGYYNLVIIITPIIHSKV